MKIQIAGIRKADDAMLAVKAGADAVGLVVGTTHVSGDEVSPETAKEIFLKLPPFICRTLITHFTDEKAVSDLIDFIKPTAVQLHSIDIDIDTIARLKAKYQYLNVIGVVHANTDTAIDRAIELSKVSDAIFTDTKANGRLGGTGVTHDWNVSAKIARLINKPLILAGGLTPDNVIDALKITRPYGVDVNTGVKENGQFSLTKMKQFVTQAKSFESLVFGADL